MSMRPQPNTALGTAEPGKDPQSCNDVSGVAVCRRMSTDSPGCARKSGTADQSSATAPATCGLAAEVPENVWYPLGRADVRTRTPGATTSGFSRLEPSRVTGPRLENS